MFTRLERNAFAVLVVLALCAAVVLAAPARAQAQAAPTAEDAQGSDANARANLSHVVVRPGDTLWSISEGRLGPDATPQRVASAAERIHALNRGRIGADADLIFVGQELLIPPAMSARPAGSTPAPETAHAAEAGQMDRAAKGATGSKAPKPVPSTALGGADAKEGEAHKPAAAPADEPATVPALPDVAVAAPVPAVVSLASNGSPASPVASLLGTIRAEAASAVSALAGSFFAAPADAGAEGRRTLGVGVLALTLLVAALMAWRLPMRRTTRGDAERWGMSSGYHGEAPPDPGTTPFVFHPGSLGGPLGGRDERDARREAPQTPGLGRRAVFVRGGAAASPGTVRTAGAPAGRGRAPRAKAKAGAVPRNGLALGAHNPEVRRAPMRARATMRARKLRPRLRPPGGASGRPKPLVAYGQTKGTVNP